ncbi:MAG: 3-oxoacyl-ACP synthase, partial [Bacilli bacterium]|nr:3-oxoacyl-ACP synthase [Bacilli bacterium]
SKQKNVTAFDINAACTGFIYALNIAEKMLRNNACKSALVIGAEVISNVIDYQDRNTCVLFGDGAGAMILEKDRKKPAYFNISAKPDEELILYVDDYIHMEGQKVYQFASRIIESSISEILAYGKIPKEAVKRVIPHQANIRIIQSAAKALDIPFDMFYVNIQKYGNTSAASIAIAFDEMQETETLQPGEQVLLVGFGAGLTYGACLVTI